MCKSKYKYHWVCVQDGQYEQIVNTVSSTAEGEHCGLVDYQQVPQSSYVAATVRGVPVQQ